MPTSLTELTEKFQGQVIDLVKNGQDAVVDVVKSLSSTVEGVLPAPAKAGLATNIPVATEAVNSAYGFAGKVLELNHNFVTAVLGAWTPSAEAKPAPKAKAAPKASTDTAAA